MTVQVCLIWIDYTKMIKHENKQLEYKIQTLEKLAELGKSLTSQMNLESLIKTILKKTSDLLQPESWHLLLKDPDKDVLYYQILINEPSINRQEPLPYGQTLSGWVALHQKPILSTQSFKNYEPSDLPEKILNEIKDKSVICIPLQSKGSLLGVVQLKHSSPDFFDLDDFNIVSTIGDFSAIAIENALQFEKIQNLTIKDDLTRLYNARYLHKLLDQEVSRSDRYQKQFSMIFLDLDKFKKVNDTHGHVHGSELLRQTAEIILQNVRDVDHCARYGGDEFVIVLPETTKEKAVQTAERIRQAIQDNVFLKEQGLNAKFTASFGVANYPEDANSKDDLIKMADEAMYVVKHTSRNRVEAFKK